jgi:hypothetical protein
MKRPVVAPGPEPLLPTRREFLKQGTGILIGTLAFASGPVALLAPSRTWALELSALDEATAGILLRLARLLYPHDRMEDAVYAMVVKALDKDAAGAGVKQLLAAGVAALDAAAGGSFLAQPPQRQLVAVKALEGTLFFEKVRGTCITALYDNPLAYAHFGYEGGSWDKGGYLERGFNDLKWLPSPPADASPPLPRSAS